MNSLEPVDHFRAIKKSKIQSQTNLVAKNPADGPKKGSFFSNWKIVKYGEGFWDFQNSDKNLLTGLRVS